MNELEKAEIKGTTRTIIGTIILILIVVNAIFINNKWLSTFLFGFVISQLIESIIDFIISDISFKKIRKQLDEMYKDDETYQKLFKGSNRK